MARWLGRQVSGFLYEGYAAKEACEIIHFRRTARIFAEIGLRGNGANGIRWGFQLFGSQTVTMRDNHNGKFAGKFTCGCPSGAQTVAKAHRGLAE